ncbi:hypothetical protein Tco_0408237 [Tanacetum coccineum]
MTLAVSKGESGMRGKGHGTANNWLTKIKESESLINDNRGAIIDLPSQVCLIAVCSVLFDSSLMRMLDSGLLSNFVLDLQKKQKNLIFQISVDILQNTNFFRAFTASASVPTIYIQQLWNTLTYEAKTGAYSFQLDETRFVLDANLLREALEITPTDQTHQFVSPPSGDAIIDFVNELGYTEEIHFVSALESNIVYDQPITNVDYAELMWEEFIQAIQTFLTDKANLDSPTKKGQKDKPHVIPYCRFKKLIICHLGRTHNIHQRSASPFHLAEEDLRLGNLKFVPKGEEDEVFRMPIPNELISNNIRNAPYYNVYLEMVAKHDQKVAAEKGGKKRTTIAKQLNPKPAKEKSSKLSPAPKPKVTKEKPSKPSIDKPPKPKPVKEKSTKATPLQKAGKGKVTKVRNVKSSFQLVDEPDEEPAQPEPEPTPEPETEYQGEGEEYDPCTLATKEASTGPSAQPQDDTSANIVRDSSSPADAETGADTDKTNSGGETEILQIGDEQGDDVTDVVNLEDKTAEIDEGQAGSDPGKTPESLPPPDDDKMDEDQAGPDPRESRVALAGPNPEPTHEDFMANVYPNVHESLKFPADEQVILDEPLSSSKTLSSMKNLDDAYTIGDQFINDKSTKDEPG